MLKIGFLTLGAAVMVYGVLLAVMFFFQRRFQYFPTHRDEKGAGNDEFTALFSSDSQFLGYFREGKSAKKVLLFFHGNGGEALDREWLSDVDPDRSLQIVLAEYPGYGARKGVPTEKALFDAALQIYDEVARRWKLPITVMAESLGTGVAAYLAVQRPVTGLAFIAPFTSAVDVASRAYKFLPVRFLMQDKYETRKYLGQVKVPLRIVHGTLDDVVPVDLGKELLASYPGPEKKLEEVPGYGHNNIPAAVVDSPFAEGFRELILQ